MYKLFVKIDGYTYRLISEANTREGLVIPRATEFNPWKIEKDGVIVDQGQPDANVSDEYISNTWIDRFGVAMKPANLLMLSISKATATKQVRALGS